MKVLVTGGAGYIGSFMTRALLEKGDEVVIVDSLERGYEHSIVSQAKFYKGNLLNSEFIKKVLSEHAFNAVIHFAGFISMGESMQNPYLYFHNNTFATIRLLEAMKETGTKNIIFSSTAGVYGNPKAVPIPETAEKNPTNPYGESKLMTERVLLWYQRIYDINFISLRYFNAAGAALDGSLGELHNPETHIIPKAIEAAMSSKPFLLFGDDYPTKDGTCVRDYIHVLDLVASHVLALEKLQHDKGGFFYNVGTGAGYSNKEVVAMVQKVSGLSFPVTVKERRVGDAVELIADPTNSKKEFRFSPKYSDLETIVKTAWKFHSKNKKLESENSQS